MFGAKLDRESVGNYTLRISATDRGETPQVGHCEVIIEIKDVNDEMPRFKDTSKTVHISEALEVNQAVITYTATDPDQNHKLEYRIIQRSVTAVDEKKQAVNVTAKNINVSDLHY